MDIRASLYIVLSVKLAELCDSRHLNRVPGESQGVAGIPTLSVSLGSEKRV